MKIYLGLKNLQKLRHIPMLYYHLTHTAYTSLRSEKVFALPAVSPSLSTESNLEQGLKLAIR